MDCIEFVFNYRVKDGFISNTYFVLKDAITNIEKDMNKPIKDSIMMGNTYPRITAC